MARDACAENKEPGISGEEFQFLGIIMASKPQVIQSMALSQLSELFHIHPWAINNFGNTMLIVLWVWFHRAPNFGGHYEPKDGSFPHHISAAWYLVSGLSPTLSLSHGFYFWLTLMGLKLTVFWTASSASLFCGNPFNIPFRFTVFVDLSYFRSAVLKTCCLGLIFAFNKPPKWLEDHLTVICSLDLNVSLMWVCVVRSSWGKVALKLVLLAWFLNIFVVG